MEAQNKVSDYYFIRRLFFKQILTNVHNYFSISIIFPTGFNCQFLLFSYSIHLPLLITFQI